MLTPTDTHDWRPHDGNSGIGQPVRRKEDLRLVTGQGCFSDDVDLPGQAYVVMVRSPHAHARIARSMSRAALAVPGVVAVLTGRDLLADRVKPIPHKQWSYHPAEIPLQNKDGAAVFAAAHFPMPADKARFVGEAVAMVIADTVAAAKDGAERVAIDYEPLPAVTHAVASAEQDAPRLWEEAPSNVLIDAEVGNDAATAAAFARAAHVVRLKTWIPRVTAVPMEPRAAVASYDAATQRYTVYAGSGGAVRLKTDIAQTLDIPDAAVRVVMRDVGGNFGSRGAIYPEFVLVAWASRRRRPPGQMDVRAARVLPQRLPGPRPLESRRSSPSMRTATFWHCAGRMSAIWARSPANFSMVQKGVEINSSIYRMPAACFRARCVASNTTPTRPYRSSGRPEVMFVMERLIDLGGAPMRARPGRDQAAQSAHQSELPYTNPFGMVYDSGDYHQVMDRALALSDWQGFGARRAEARKRGKVRGIGLANYIDTATGVPRERAEVTVQPDGFVDVVIGTVSNGQGHETSFAQLVTEWLGVPFERVRLLTGDTDTVQVGGGTHSGRGMRLASIIIHKATRGIIAKGARIAAHVLEAPAAEIEFADGRFSWKGTNRSLDLFEVAGAARERCDLSDELRGALAETCDETVNVAGYGYGSHVCEVEIDPETGVVEIVRHTTVDDVGRAVNPLIIHGQTHGGIAQGVGEALLEQCFYDAGTGQPLAGSFMDYAMPRASDFPSLHHGHQRGALDHAPARHPSGRRGRHDAGARRRRQRDRGCARRLRRHPYRDARHARAHLAGDQRHGAADAVVTYPRPR